MTYQQKPGTPGEVLAQSGVKGMRWGVRNSKKPSASEIHGARQRQAVRKSAAKGGDSKAAREHQTHPDRITASRMTAGEKAAAIMLGGPVGLAVVVSNSSHTRAVARNVATLKK